MRKRRTMEWLWAGVILAIGVLFTIPVILTVLGSFHVEYKLSFLGYKKLFFECLSFYRMFWNSMLYSVSITIITIIIAVPAAYAFCYAEFPGRKILFLAYLVIMLMPLQVMVLPNYIGLRDMKLLDTPFAIIIPTIFSPLAVVVIHQYMKGIDNHITEAARLETNSFVRVIWHCVVPQIKPCIFAVCMLVFAEAWNMVEQPLLYLNNDLWNNLSMMFNESGRYQTEVILPAAVMFMIPVTLLYLLLKDEFQRGLKT